MGPPRCGSPARGLVRSRAPGTRAMSRAWPGHLEAITSPQPLVMAAWRFGLRGLGGARSSAAATTARCVALLGLQPEPATASPRALLTGPSGSGMPALERASSRVRGTAATYIASLGVQPGTFWPLVPSTRPSGSGTAPRELASPNARATAAQSAPCLGGLGASTWLPPPTTRRSECGMLRPGPESPHALGTGAASMMLLGRWMLTGPAWLLHRTMGR
mmetsp:Transcript_18103/g.40825  ORF Transcript_18103/g.40825 Transcript_18103/m.40825 type:complete len:218 (+) Transcript_18103:420-1073(+)